MTTPTTEASAEFLKFLKTNYPDAVVLALIFPDEKSAEEFIELYKQVNPNITPHKI